MLRKIKGSRFTSFFTPRESFHGLKFEYTIKNNMMAGPQVLNLLQKVYRFFGFLPYRGMRCNSVCRPLTYRKPLTP